MNISDRMKRMKPSATRGTSDLAAKRAAQGLHTVNLTTGEPDFPSPPAAVRYAEQAMREGHTHYTVTTGITELKSALIDYYKERHKVTFQPNEICVGSGAKPLLYECFGVLVNPGDEVIIPTPAWVSYVEQIDVFDGKPVLVDTKDSAFIPSIESIENAITSRTVAICINSPHNPTGAVYDRKLMADLCTLAHKHGVMLINDEVYERLTFGCQYINPLADVPETRDNVLTITGVSKAYAMTGWRIGFALGPSALISKMATLQGHITSSASSVSQWAAVGAIREAQNDTEVMVAEYARRMDYVYGELVTMPNIKVTKPRGAFYFFVDVRPSYGKKSGEVTITDDLVFCAELMNNGVALVPGTAFLCPGFCRISYSASMDELRDAMQLMRAFLGKLRQD